MSHLPADPPDFFHRGPTPAARLLILGLASIALMFLDTRYGYLEQVRQAVAVVLSPLQRAAAWPGELVSSIGVYFASKRELEQENDMLQRRLAEKGVAAQGHASLQAENARLKGLLDVRRGLVAPPVATRVVYGGRDPFSQRVFVDKGRDAGMTEGAAVVDADGVVGQVTRLYPHMAEVTLVTDKDHAIPVKVERSGVRAVMTGSGAGRAPQLRFVAPAADVRIGDLLVTSGLDGTYPPGLAVAKVTELERESGQMFARIALAPVAGFDRSTELLVLSRETGLPERPEEVVEADTTKKAPAKFRLRRGG